MQLIELLEIPQLVDACSRNGFHDEALDLAAFVNSLERKHIFAASVQQSQQQQPQALTSEQTSTRRGNSVVMSIVNDVHATLAELRRQLLVRLTEESSLPKLLQTLTSLRRLDGILVDRQIASLSATGRDSDSAPQDMEQMRVDLMHRVETALQMNFLEARTVWVRTQVIEGGRSRVASAPLSGNGTDRSVRDEAAGERGNGGGTMLGPYGQGIELLEIYRSSWFSVVSQYNALFAASDGNHPSSTLLAYWIEDQLDVLLTELSQLLRNIDEGPSVRSLLEQSILFADRMREVGCDFKEQILPVFEEAILLRLESTWNKGFVNFKQMVVTERVMLRGVLGQGGGEDDEWRGDSEQVC